MPIYLIWNNYERVQNRIILTFFIYVSFYFHIGASETFIWAKCIELQRTSNEHNRLLYLLVFLFFPSCSVSFLWVGYFIIWGVYELQVLAILATWDYEGRPLGSHQPSRFVVLARASCSHTLADPQHVFTFQRLRYWQGHQTRDMQKHANNIDKLWQGI